MAATYTFTARAQTAGQASNFGNQVNDGAHDSMNYGAGPQTTDISASPLSSPQTVANNSVTTLTIPSNAVQVTFLATTNTVNISEADATVASKYFTIPTGQQVVVDVARTKVLYLEANTGSATLSYFFKVI